MAKLTEKERVGFEEIMKDDMKAISGKLANQIKDFWAKAREEVLSTKGFDELIKEKDTLQKEIQERQERIHAINEEMHAESLDPEQVVELGGNPDPHGRFKGAHFHGIPVTSKFDYDIVEYIRSHIDLNIPAKFIYDLGRSAMRALAMSGTFEEAREAYEEFYSLDFRKYGVDIPPRLKEVRNDINNLEYTKQTVSMPVNQQGDLQALEQKEKESQEKIDYTG